MPIVDNLEEIMQRAGTLGEAIRRHPRYVALREADDRVRADTVATEALEAYNKAAADIARKERFAQPVEVEDKRRLERLQQVVVSNEAIKAFMRAQADYAELMRKMNDAIFRSLAGDEKPAAPQA